MRELISSGSPFEADIGYSRAVVDGDWVFVSGTTGFDYATMTIAEDVVAQTEQCLATITDALAQAGCTLADVVRVRYVLPRVEDFERCWPALRGAFGRVRPAATMIAAGLSDPRMRIEVEVTARRQGATAEGVGTEEAPASLARVRERIDVLDDEIVVLLAERQRLVEQAGRSKADEAAVRAPDRRAQVMVRLRGRALAEGVDPGVVERVWTAMIDAFVDLELREHRAAARGPAGSSRGDPHR